jgi:hypothetical protein
MISVAEQVAEQTHGQVHRAIGVLTANVRGGANLAAIAEWGVHRAIGSDVAPRSDLACAMDAVRAFRNAILIFVLAQTRNIFVAFHATVVQAKGEIARAIGVIVTTT